MSANNGCMCGTILDPPSALCPVHGIEGWRDEAWKPASPSPRGQEPAGSDAHREGEALIAPGPAPSGVAEGEGTGVGNRCEAEADSQQYWAFLRWMNA